MKLTLEEQKQKIRYLNKQISNMAVGFKPTQNNEQNLYADDYEAKRDLDAEQRHAYPGDYDEYLMIETLKIAIQRKDWSLISDVLENLENKHNKDLDHIRKQSTDYDEEPYDPPTLRYRDTGGTDGG